MMERLQRIAERQIPIGEKDCHTKRYNKMVKRFIVVTALEAELSRLGTQEEKEHKIQQWENVN